MNAPFPKAPKHGRIKPKRNVKATAKQKAYHKWLMEGWPCVCGCGKPSTIVHHPLTEHPDQCGRRDHTFVVPMNAYCHFDLHQKFGSEEAFKPEMNFAEVAADFRQAGIMAGMI